MTDRLGPRDDIEELLLAQAHNLNLRAAVMACLSGQESRRWTIGELAERFRNLGLPVSKAGITAALAELALELELSVWAPWQLIERGSEWMLTPKSELLEVLGAVRKLPLGKTALSQEHKAVLLVVLGHRRKGGVSKTRIEEILKLDAVSYLKDLKDEKLIYADPSREVKFWRPTPASLVALGFRSYAEIPVLKELERWFEGIGSGGRDPSALDSYFTRVSRQGARRQMRELERRRTVRAPQSLFPGGILDQKSGSDLLGRDVQPGSVPQPAHESPQCIVQDRAA
ncbi:MAG: hypothetical protein JO151_14945 [Verrucomicrobia bacterium]|nr:hypothetical protein [Verrucomicrobiota bacterium]